QHFQFTQQAVGIVGEFIPKILQHIGRTTHAGYAIIAMLGYFHSRSRYHKRAERRDIEGAFSIASSSAQVDSGHTTQIQGNAQLHHGLPKTAEFLQGDGPHQENGEKTGYLARIKLPLSESYQYVFGLLLAEAFMFK